MAFLSEPEELGEQVQVLADDQTGMPDIAALMGQLRDRELLYVCGPVSLIDAVKAVADAAEVSNRIRFELFSAPTCDDIEPRDGSAFEVELRCSGLVINVTPMTSILQAVRAAGVDVLSNSEDGIFGSCETAIVRGRAEHRYQVLTPDEQSANTAMMICVSRSLDERLVLDL